MLQKTDPAKVETRIDTFEDFRESEKGRMAVLAFSKGGATDELLRTYYEAGRKWREENVAFHSDPYPNVRPACKHALVDYCAECADCPACDGEGEVMLFTGPAPCPECK